LAVAQNLAQREISEEDYDLLIQLDGSNNQNSSGNNSNSNGTSSYSQIPEKVIKSWPSERIRENSLLLNPGYQCRICLRPYQTSQILRKLPNCKHKFHLECIDNWLLHSHPTCPIDGQIVWDPLTAQLEKEEKK
jgi:E3 ubiquitin-protein ligase ZSWIM2